MITIIKKIRLAGGSFFTAPSIVFLVSLSVLLAPRTSFAAFGAPVSYDIGNNSRSVFAVDLNGDGRLDLAAANYGSNTVSVLLNNGSAIFSAPVNYATGNNPATVFAADLDGDGDSDLAVGNFVSDNVSVFMNNGDGTFAATVNYAAGDGAWSVFARDLNADGNPDLVVTNSNAATVSVLINNGNGTFAAAVNYGVQTVPSSVYAADFNGDAKPDLAVANYFAATVSILINNGNGTFAAAVNYQVGNWSISDFNYPIALYVADLDGDGDADIATANYDNNQVSVLLNNGNGTFPASVEYAVGSHPPSVFAADLDGDGDRDLVTANYFDGNVSVLANNGNGTFAAAVNYSAGGGSWSVVAADFDADSDLDLAVTNYDLAKVSILLSDAFVPPLSGGGSSLNATIKVVKNVINDNGGIKTVGDFLLFINGNQVGSGIINNFPFPAVEPYVVTETADAGYTSTFSGDCDTNGRLNLSPGDNKVCIITNNDIGTPGTLSPAPSPPVVPPPVTPPVPPLIHVTKVPSLLTLPAGGGMVTYYEKITNPGTVPLSNVTLTDDKCSPMKFIAGDVNHDAKLDVTETWRYTCTTNLTLTTTNTATAVGEANGFTVSDSAAVTVAVSASVPASDLVNIALLLHPNDLINLQEQTWWNSVDLPVRQQAYAQIQSILGSAQTLADYVSSNGIQNVQNYSWWSVSPYKQQAWNIIQQGLPQPSTSQQPSIASWPAGSTVR